MPLLDPQGRIGGKISIVDAGLVLLAAMIVMPMGLFVQEIYFGQPRMDEVTPESFAGGVDQTVALTIQGRHLDRTGTVQLGKVDLKTVSITPGELRVIAPENKFPPGAHQLLITSKRGLIATWKNTIRVHPCIPVVEEVSPRRFGQMERINLVILGNNFRKECSVTLGDFVVPEVRYINSQRLEVVNHIPALKPGWHRVRVTDFYGDSDELPGAVEITAAPFGEPALAPPAFQPTPEIILENEALVEVVCSFQEPSLPVKRKLLKQGAVMSAMHVGRPIARIRKILGKITLPPKEGKLVLAVLTLVCEQNPAVPGVFLYGRGFRSCPPRGEVVEIGKRLPFQFQSLDIEGLVLCDPVLIEKHRD